MPGDEHLTCVILTVHVSAPRLSSFCSHPLSSRLTLTGADGRPPDDALPRGRSGADRRPRADAAAPLSPGAPPPRAPLVPSGCHRLHCLAASTAAATPDPPARAADAASFVSLDALVARCRDARGELALFEESLATSVSLGTDLPLRDLKRRLGAGALADFPAAATRLDRFIDAPELQDWEEAVWTSVSEETRGSRDIDAVTGKRLRGVERTNDFLCFVFSCFNDPRAPASTDVLLSLKLLGDGVQMGLRGDERITAEGLTLSVQDVREKLDAFLDVVETSRLTVANPGRRRT